MRVVDSSSPVLRLVRTWVLVARAWGLRRLAFGAAGMILLSVAWRGPISVPGRSDVAELVWPLAPCLLALVVPMAAARAHADQERCAPRAGWGRRLAFVATLGVTSIALAGALALLHPFAVVLRNALLLSGLGFAACVLLPPSARWIPVAFLPIVMWLLGARPVGEDPAGWAVLLHASGSCGATWAAAVSFAGGGGLYVAVGRPLLR